MHAYSHNLSSELEKLKQQVQDLQDHHTIVEQFTVDRESKDNNYRWTYFVSSTKCQPVIELHLIYDGGFFFFFSHIVLHGADQPCDEKESTGEEQGASTNYKM